MRYCLLDKNVKSVLAVKCIYQHLHTSGYLLTSNELIGSSVTEQELKVAVQPQSNKTSFDISSTQKSWLLCFAGGPAPARYCFFSLV